MFRLQDAIDVGKKDRIVTQNDMMGRAFAEGRESVESVRGSGRGARRIVASGIVLEWFVARALVDRGFDIGSFVKS